MFAIAVKTKRMSRWGAGNEFLRAGPLHSSSLHGLPREKHSHALIPTLVTVFEKVHQCGDRTPAILSGAEQLATVESRMADVTPSDEVNDVLRDVRGVVADTLEILGHQHQLEGGKYH